MMCDLICYYDDARSDLKILIIDDNDDITTMFSKYMTIKGHLCSVVNDGKSALDLIEKNTFDVVILDIAMPKFSGNDVIDTLYNSGKIKHQNIITLTASSISDDIESALKNKGVRLCLKKPIDPDILLDHMQQFENIKTT